jgi:predicted oxidoreductase
MADPLSTVASAIAIVQSCKAIGDEVNNVCQNYKKALEILSSIVWECRATRDVLDDFQKLIQDEAQRCAETMRRKDRLENFSRAVREIDQVLGDLSNEVSKIRGCPDKRLLLGFQFRAGFIMREGKIKDCLQKIRNQRATVAFILSAIQMQVEIPRSTKL